jgi:uncharacterized delta-60 repeat protein
MKFIRFNVITILFKFILFALIIVFQVSSANALPTQIIAVDTPNDELTSPIDSVTDVDAYVMYLPIIMEALGILDPTFDEDGRVTTDFYGSTDIGNAVFVQPDGKILVAGYADTGDFNYDFALARYNPDGDLDTSFGNGGLVTTDFGSYEEGRALSVQSDNKIIIAGIVGFGGSNHFALVRYNPDGSLDTSFGNGGLATTDFNDVDEEEGYALTLQPDGKIVVVGQVETVSSIDFALARYSPDGSLDTSFGNGGLVTTDFDGRADHGDTVAVQPDGRIVVGGSAYIGSVPDFAIARYNSDGSLDNSFGIGGLVTTDFSGSDDYGNSVALQADNKIVLAGTADTGGSRDFALARYNSDGSLDTSFGNGGLVTTDFFELDDGCSSVVIQPDGKIVVAGGTRTGGSTDFAVARYNPDGSLDESFGRGGLATTDFFNFRAGGSDIALQPDGKIIVVGRASINYANPDFALARYLSDSNYIDQLSADN